MKALGFGAIVWDDIAQCTPSAGAGPLQGTGREENLGGAILNTMVHLWKLGCETHMLSALGNDELGRKTLAAVDQTGVSCDLLRTVDTPTCLVRVEFGADGEPSYIIDDNVSWDYIAVDEADIDLINSQRFDCFCFGSIEQRSPVSRTGLRMLLEQGRFSTVFCDINLRTPFYSQEVVEYSLQKSDIVKMNMEEATVIGEMFNFKASDVTELMARFRALFGIDGICITCGPDGVHYACRQESGFAPAYRVEVCDTVGAGDAFCAGLLYSLSNAVSFGQACEFGSRMGALIASRKSSICDWHVSELAELQPYE